MYTHAHEGRRLERVTNTITCIFFSSTHCHRKRCHCHRKLGYNNISENCGKVRGLEESTTVTTVLKCRFRAAGAMLMGGVRTARVSKMDSHALTAFQVEKEHAQIKACKARQP